MSAAYSSPATNAPASSRGAVGGLPPAVLVQAVELGARVELVEGAVQVQVREDAARSPRPRRRRRAARRRRSCRRAAGPSRSSRMPGIVSASTRLPARTRAATPPVVCSSSSSSSMPIARSCSASCARERGRRVRDEANPVPVARADGARRGGAPAIGSPETCSTPSTSRRIAAMDAESIRSEIAFRFSRSSGPGGQHAQKSSTRVEALFDVEESAGLTDGRAPARAREARAGRPRDRPGRALAAAQPRARDRPDRRAAARGDEGPAAAPADEADAGVAERRLDEKKRRRRTKRLRRAAPTTASTSGRLRLQPDERGSGLELAAGAARGASRRRSGRRARRRATNGDEEDDGSHGHIVPAQGLSAQIG